MKCPVYTATLWEGKIDSEFRELDSVLTISHLNVHDVHPLPYRLRSEVWEYVKRLQH